MVDACHASHVCEYGTVTWLAWHASTIAQVKAFLRCGEFAQARADDRV